MKFKKLQKKIKQKNKLESQLKKLKLKPIIGQVVYMNDKYKDWLKNHLDEIFDVSDKKAQSKTEDEEYQVRKFLIKHKVKGKIVKATHDDGDIILKVKFNMKKMKKGLKNEMLLNIEDVSI